MLATSVKSPLSKGTNTTPAAFSALIVAFTAGTICMPTCLVESDLAIVVKPGSLCIIHIMMPMQLVAAGQSGNIVLQQVIQQVKPETSNFKTEWEVH